MSNRKLKRYSYLAIIPRGLESEVCQGLQKEAKAVVDIGTDDGNDQCIRNNEGINNKPNALCISSWNEEDDDKTMQEALRDFAVQKIEKRKKRQTHEIKKTLKHQPTNSQLEEKITSEWLPRECHIGSVKLRSTGQHISFGYAPTKNDQKELEDHFAPIWTCTGQVTGTVWMQLETDRKEVSQKVIAPSRKIGPLLALIAVQTNNRCLEASASAVSDGKGEIGGHDPFHRYHRHSLEEMTTEVTKYIELHSNEFSERLDLALQVWRDCVETTWKSRLPATEFTALRTRILDDRLRFRISCMRVEPTVLPSALSQKRKHKQVSNIEQFSYSRNELCIAIMDACGSKLVPGFYEQPPRWSVSLESFDVELVICILPPDGRSRNGKLAFGISLCPYSFLKSKSFASGHIPPDVTLPYLGGNILSRGIIRLRPTTAHILLNIANLKKYDFVLDPCAGIGTIPVEVEQFHKQNQNNSRQFISIGGDLILNNPKYTEVAGMMQSLSRRQNGVNGVVSTLKSSSLLVAWDAAHLPVRTSSVDVIVSDLPFGQQCLSMTALNQLLPLIFLECARVLTPLTGRMVVLAGGSPVALVANIEKLSGKYWKKPIPRVSPVSIGGILAWIIRIDRNQMPIDLHRTSEQLTQARKIAQKRDRISRQRKSASCEQQTGKRRRKANS